MGICRYEVDRGKYLKTPGLFWETCRGLPLYPKVRLKVRKGQYQNDMFLRKYFVFCRNLISFCLVPQGDFASRFCTNQISRSMVLRLTACLYWPVMSWILRIGLLWLFPLSLSVSASAERFSRVASTEYSFSFSFSCGMELRGALR